MEQITIGYSSTHHGIIASRLVCWTTCQPSGKRRKTILPRLHSVHFLQTKVTNNCFYPHIRPFFFSLFLNTLSVYTFRSSSVLTAHTSPTPTPGWTRIPQVTKHEANRTFYFSYRLLEIDYETCLYYLFYLAIYN